MKILVAVPTFESIMPDTFKSIYDLDKGEHEVIFEFIRGYDVATARNKIAQRGIDLETDYVFMVDNDVVLPSDALLKLLENDKDICLGYYAHRNQDNVCVGRTCICKLYDNDGKAYYHYPLESEYTTEEMECLAHQGETAIVVHGGGMGCALIKTNVFRTAQYPWYDWVNYGDKNRGMLSEDLYFCSLVRNYGLKVHADVRVHCGHLFRYIQY